ncbi:hypothetical protein [Acetobacter estunensis]|uniref:hypothetical protein n=1 Tax=Acetobacter estunensis TaxID=104097 RepID=UPI001C2D39E2|nr:hypothetical protein [Acetobacter estunensis]MBV1838499.1 hypothetical protein [Acetobacter estunensis]
MMLSSSFSGAPVARLQARALARRLEGEALHIEGNLVLPEISDRARARLRRTAHEVRRRRSAKLLESSLRELAGREVLVERTPRRSMRT